VSSEPTAVPSAGGLTGVHPGRLFAASCMSLISTAVAFGVVTSFMGQIRDDFVLDNAEAGLIGGAAIWGFSLSIIALGPLCDLLGMRLRMGFAFLCHFAGVLGMIFARAVSGAVGLDPFYILFVGALTISLGNGTVEAVCNPLIATIYPDRKIAKLSQFHMWFPGGIVIGGLIAFGIDRLDVATWQGFAAWQVKLAVILIPTILYGILFLGQKFPKTERVQAGISFGGMVKATFLRPLFLLLFFCMMLTASLELGPNRWMAEAMQGALNQLELPQAGILVLVWISGLMAILRYYAGPVVHKLSPTGILLGSAVLSGTGLCLMTYVTHSPILVAVCATVFAVGVCYFWPTMLGVAAERIPKGGALALAILGGTGMAIVGAVTTPIMGVIADRYGNEQLNAKVPEAVVCLTQVVETYPDLKAKAPNEAAQQALDNAVVAAESVLDVAVPAGGVTLPGETKLLANALRAAEKAAPDSDAGRAAKNLLGPADEFGALWSFRWVSALAIVLVVAFGGLYLRERMKGGYKAEHITAG